MNAPADQRASCHFSGIHHGRTHFVNYQLVPAHGWPPWTSITFDRCPSDFHLPKPRLNLCMTHCLIDKILRNNIVACWQNCMQMCCSTFSVIVNATCTTCTTTGFGRLWATEQWERVAIIHVYAQKSKGMRPHSWPHAPSCLKEKKYDRILFDQATYNVCVLACMLVCVLYNYACVIPQ